MRGSEPMPRRTASMSAPTRSAKFAEFVHERDARSEHRVGGVLGEFRRANVHVERALVVAVERRIKPLHLLAGALAGGVLVAADHDAVRPREVLHGRAFLEELGVRHDREACAARRARARCGSITPFTPHLAVPTGTVDLSTITLKPFMWRPMSRAAASTYCRSAEPSSSGGRAHRDEQARRRARPLALTSVENFRRPALRLRAITSCKTRLVDRHAAAVQDRDLAFDRRRGRTRRCRCRQDTRPSLVPHSRYR